ncbi:MAG TPA: 2-phospho-L-lactate guanylyltransferase [Methylomirabilota bacterium]|nr:2-phospho-L-lactate guanylyltransferase [Methylomirabilota bacterium]
MIAAVVPVKRLDEAKGRLAALFPPDERSRLALAMLEDVLRALQAVPRIELVAVVSPDDAALRRARELAAEPLPEPPLCRGVNQALTHASSLLAGRGADAVLVVAADLPLASPADIEAVLDALPQRGIAIAPTHDRGTGALALRPPQVIGFRYGRHSSVYHKREAVARGLPAPVLHLDSLAHDVDEPDDITHLLGHPAESVTHRLLAELRVSERLGAAVGRAP